MALSEFDKQNIKKQIADLEDRMAAEKVASDGLSGKEKDASEDESVMRKQWNRVHYIIHNYEKEIEKLNGQFILAPFSEQDVLNQALEKGRLYQAPASQDPKVIPEMVGEGLSPNPKIPHEGTYLAAINKLIDTMTVGVNGGAGASNSTLRSNYAAGENFIYTESTLTSNRWYLMGYVTLVKIGAITPITIPSTPTNITYYKCAISERLLLPGMDSSVPAGAGVINFGGYTNLERSSHHATTTSQAIFDSLYGKLKTAVDSWRALIEEQLSLQSNNPDPNMSTVAKTTNQNFIDRLLEYKDNGYRINDGVPGIGILQSIITDRQAYRSTRPNEIKVAKEAYYAERVNYTKMRCNLQSGTLTRMKFLDTLRDLTPKGGNPGLAKMLKSLKAMLEQG